MRSTRSIALTLAFAAAAALSSTAAAAPACNVDSLLHEAGGLYRDGQVRDEQWVNVARADGSRAASGPKSVTKDGTVVSLRYTREANARTLAATQDFTLKSNWPLNPKFSFRSGDTVLIRGTLTAPDGEKFYVVSGDGRFGNRLMFVRMDGTVCGKLINPGYPRSNFLQGEFTATPAATFAMQQNLGSDVMTVKVVYLGASAGTAKYREVWSIGGKVVADENLEFDTEATDIEVGGLTLRQSNPTATSVKVSTPAIPERIELTGKVYKVLRLVKKD